MTDGAAVRLYLCPLPEEPGASHRLLFRAAAQQLPGPLTLDTLAHGKPFFREAPQLHFNISHSGGLWACAFADSPVGVDVQRHCPIRREAIARRFFCPEEVDWLRRTQYAAFFDLWTAKESYLKYTGQGLRAGLRSVCLVERGLFPCAPDACCQLISAPEGFSLCLCTRQALPVCLLTL